MASDLDNSLSSVQAHQNMLQRHCCGHLAHTDGQRVCALRWRCSDDAYQRTDAPSLDDAETSLSSACTSKEGSWQAYTVKFVTASEGCRRPHDLT